MLALLVRTQWIIVRKISPNFSYIPTSFRWKIWIIIFNLLFDNFENQKTSGRKFDANFTCKKHSKKKYFLFFLNPRIQFYLLFQLFPPNLLQKFNIDKYHFLILKFWMQFIDVKKSLSKKIQKMGLRKLLFAKKGGGNCR